MGNQMICLDKNCLTNDLIQLFTALAVPQEDAEMIADTLILADQWGVSSHGVLRVEKYVKCIQSGGIIPDAKFEIEQQCGSWARTSGNGGLGIPACTKATKLAVEMARQTGVGIVNVRMSHHNGAEGVYTDYIARQGMVGIVMSTGNPIMAVTGSAAASIGNNPFSYAVPAGKYGTVMMDVAMSAVADGKVQVAKAMGKLLPPDCILDSEGKPSNVPDDYLNGGVLLPFGAHKGYGLAVMVECLAGILSGAALTQQINSWNMIPGKCGNTGHMIITLDIAKMMPPAEFTASVETMVEEFKAAKKADGVKEIYYPGELEQRRKAEAGSNVMILESTMQSLIRAAEKVGTRLSCFQNG